MNFASLASDLKALCALVVVDADDVSDLENTFDHLDPSSPPSGETKVATIELQPSVSLLVLDWLVTQAANKNSVKNWALASARHETSFEYRITFVDGQSIRLRQISGTQAVSTTKRSDARTQYEAIQCALGELFAVFALQPALASALKTIAPLPADPAPIRSASTPIAYTIDSPPMALPARVFDRQSIPLTTLANVLVTGATGSGKTTAYMYNLAEAAVGYCADGLKSAMLLIDPKAELKSRLLECTAKLGREHDVIVVGENAPKLHAFRYDDGRDLKERIKAARAHVANADYDEDRGGWQGKSLQFVTDILLLDQAVARSAGGLGLISLAFPNSVQARASSVWTRLEYFVRAVQQSTVSVHNSSAMVDLVCSLNGRKASLNPLSMYAAMDSQMGVEQIMYVARGAQYWISSLATIEKTGLVDYNPMPVEGENGFDLTEACDSGKLIVYQPGDTAAHTAIARLLKEQYFFAVTHRKELLRPQFYVVDEFQRFITSDHTTGEHAFLDRCRGYRCIAILATQSVAALASSAPVTSVQAVLSHCPTKVWLRNSDPATRQVLSECVPNARHLGLPHVTAVRPLSGLLTGQAYYQLGTEWGISQYHHPQSATTAS